MGEGEELKRQPLEDMAEITERSSDALFKRSSN